MKHLLAKCFLLIVFHLVSHNVTASCKTPTVESTIDQCESKLISDPRNTKYRLTLVDALLEKGRRDKALKVLQDGVELSPGNDAFKQKLAYVESLQSEENWVKHQRTNNNAQDRQLSTQRKLATIRCKTLKGEKALAICNEALKEFPDDSVLHTGKGRALLSLDRIVDSMKEFTIALELDSTNAEAKQGLVSAQADRDKLIEKCHSLKNLRKALDACDKALYKGQPDEYSILVRQGDLLMSMNRKSASIKAYRSAMKIKPLDKRRMEIASFTQKKPEQEVTLISKSTDKAPDEQVETQTEEGTTTVEMASPPVESITLDQSDKQNEVKPVGPVMLTHKPVMEQQHVTQIAEPVNETQQSRIIVHYTNAPLSDGITY